MALDRFRQVGVWVSSFFIGHVTRRVGAGFGVGVSGSEPRFAGDKCTCSHRFFAVGFGWGFLWCSEPNQAEMDAAGTEESVHRGGMGNPPLRVVTDRSKWY